MVGVGSGWGVLGWMGEAWVIDWLIRHPINQSVQFHTPVNRKQYKDYYDVIQAPIDLKTMHKVA